MYIYLNYLYKYFNHQPFDLHPKHDDIVYISIQKKKLNGFIFFFILNFYLNISLVNDHMHGKLILF